MEKKEYEQHNIEPQRSRPREVPSEKTPLSAAGSLEKSPRFRKNSRSTSIMRQSDENPSLPNHTPISLKNFTPNVLFFNDIQLPPQTPQKDPYLSFSEALENEVQETIRTEPLIDNEFEMPPSLQQFAAEYSQIYPIEDDNIHGFSIMFDLNSKQHGRVTIEQLSQFGVRSDWKLRSRLYNGKDLRRESSARLNANIDPNSTEPPQSPDQMYVIDNTEGYDLLVDY